MFLAEAGNAGGGSRADKKTLHASNAAAYSLSEILALRGGEITRSLPSAVPAVADVRLETHTEVEAERGGKETFMARSAGQNFISAFAEEFAEKCVNVLLARLPKPILIQPRYLTVQQAEDYIGHSKKSFEYLMSKKMFPVIRRDRLVLIDKNDLDRFMAEQKR